MKYLLDANILIDHLNNVSQATNLVLSLKVGDIAISAITLSEVLAGCEGQEKEHFLYFVDQFRFFEINKTVAVSAAQLRREHGLKLPDAYQAAIALEHKLTLLTRNSKDFSPKRYLFVKIPYTL